MISDRLDTAHLTLRPFEIEDDVAVFEYWQSDPGWEKYNASVPDDFSLADAREFIREIQARSRNSSPSWAILRKSQVVGVVSLTFGGDHRFSVIGFGIHGDLRGRGLCAEAVAKVIGEAFEHYPQLGKITANTDADNAPSARVLAKLGFVREGTLRQNQFVKGRLVDEAVYGLLRAEWDAR